MSVISFLIVPKATKDFCLSQLSHPSGHFFWPVVSGGFYPG